VPQLSDAGIASTAQKTADATACGVVIEVEPAHLAGVSGSADGAASLLCREHLSISAVRNAEAGLEVDVGLAVGIGSAPFELICGVLLFVGFVVGDNIRTLTRLADRLQAIPSRTILVELALGFPFLAFGAWLEAVLWRRLRMLDAPAAVHIRLSAKDAPARSSIGVSDVAIKLVHWFRGLALYAGFLSHCRLSVCGQLG
jgi:hypothetical protein